MKLHWYMFKDTLLASVLAVVCLAIPVTFVSVFAHLEAVSFHYEPFLLLAYGLAPMITYMIIPAAVSCAVVWCYGNYYRDHVIAVMQAAGISPLATRAAGLTMATGATVIGYTLSMVVAPNSVKGVQDLIHMMRYAPKPYLLDAGRFYSLDNGKRVIYFQNRLTEQSVTGVFLKEQSAAGQEYILTSRKAMFQPSASGALALLLDGQVQVFAADGDDVQVLEFGKMVRRTALSGNVLPTRNWIGEYELGPIDFFRGRVTGDSYAARLWTREAVKRFCIPLLALSHTIFGLGMLSLFGDSSGRRRQLVVPLIGCILIVTHLVIVVLEESVQRVGTVMAAATVFVMLCEYLVGLSLIVWGRRRYDRPAR